MHPPTLQHMCLRAAGALAAALLSVGLATVAVAAAVALLGVRVG
jgi:hypothetical protein